MYGKANPAKASITSKPKPVKLWPTFKTRKKRMSTTIPRSTAHPLLWKKGVY